MAHSSVGSRSSIRDTYRTATANARIFTGFRRFRRPRRSSSDHLVCLVCPHSPHSPHLISSHLISSVPVLSTRDGVRAEYGGTDGSSLFLPQWPSPSLSLFSFSSITCIQPLTVTRASVLLSMPSPDWLLPDPSPYAVVGGADLPGGHGRVSSHVWPREGDLYVGTFALVRGYLLLLRETRMRHSDGGENVKDASRGKVSRRLIPLPLHLHPVDDAFDSTLNN